MISKEWPEMSHEDQIEYLEWILCPVKGTVKIRARGFVSWKAENGDLRLEKIDNILEVMDWLCEPSKDGSGE